MVQPSILNCLLTPSFQLFSGVLLFTGSFRSLTLLLNLCHNQSVKVFTRPVTRGQASEFTFLIFCEEATDLLRHYLMYKMRSSGLRHDTSTFTNVAATLHPTGNVNVVNVMNAHSQWFIILSREQVQVQVTCPAVSSHITYNIQS